MASSAFGERQRARIMITVKTYPELSNKYRETSCVAGIRLDQGAPRHVRLFPVPFRLLAEDAQFSKYSIIEVDVEPHGQKRDSRPERLRPDLATLEFVGSVPPDAGWKKRYQYVEPLVAPSLCAIKRDKEQRGTSLGIFQPVEVTFRLTPAEAWSASKTAPSQPTSTGPRAASRSPVAPSPYAGGAAAARSPSPPTPRRTPRERSPSPRSAPRARSHGRRTVWHHGRPVDGGLAERRGDAVVFPDLTGEHTFAWAGA